MNTIYANDISVPFSVYLNFKCNNNHIETYLYDGFGDLLMIQRPMLGEHVCFPVIEKKDIKFPKSPDDGIVKTFIKRTSEIHASNKTSKLVLKTYKVIKVIQYFGADTNEIHFDYFLEEDN